MGWVGRFLALVLALAVSACAPPAPPGGRGGLTMHMSSEPSTLNPVTATDAYAGQVNDYIYESLLKRDEKTLELVPVLAEGWEIAEDHLTYVFHLRRDVRWQDGVPFTAKDVLFSFERIRDPKVDAAPLRNYYQDIESLEALDDYTLKYRYKTPYFRALEFCGGIPIVPAHVFKEGEDFNTHPIGRAPVGTGPYRFLRWDTGKEIVLTRNEDYYGEKPAIAQITFKIITDSTVALQVLKTGGLDFMGLRPIQWVKQTEGARFRDQFRKLKYYSPNYNYLGWNEKNPLFADARVRRALTMLVPREAILKELLFGLGAVVTGTFFLLSPDYDKTLTPWPYDPGAAAALLREAGWESRNGDGILQKDGRPFSFEFLISAGSKFAEQMATILQESLKEAGIRMSIRKLEWAVFIQSIQERRFDACTLGWQLSWESDPYQIWHSSQTEKGSNFVGFSNPEADRLIDEARREFDPEKRHALYRRFSRILYDEQPYTFLFTGESLVAVSRRFENVQVYPLGLVPREWRPAKAEKAEAP